MPRSLLVNFFYAPAVGHALEGLRYALGYAAADPDLDVSILLNGATAVEFVECCSFIKARIRCPSRSSTASMATQQWRCPTCHAIGTTSRTSTARTNRGRSSDFPVSALSSRRPGGISNRGVAGSASPASAHAQGRPTHGPPHTRATRRRRAACPTL